MYTKKLGLDDIRNKLRETHFYNTIVITFMKWVCNYCQKVVERDNFIEVLEEGMEDDEYHAWRRIMD